jgi:hypothetical protein
LTSLTSNLAYFSILLVTASVFLSVPPYVFAQTPFTISIRPDQLILGTRTGSADQVIVSVLSGEAFNGTVSLSVTGIPNEVTATLQDRAAYLQPQSIFTTNLEVTISPTAELGNYTISLAATSQSASVFYAAVSNLNLLIQEDGQPTISAKTNTGATWVVGQFEIPLLAAMLLLGIGVGALSTYALTHKKTGIRKARKHRRANYLGLTPVGCLIFCSLRVFRASRTSLAP